MPDPTKTNSRSDPPAQPRAGPLAGRRRLLQGGLGVAPVLMTLVSRPVLAVAPAGLVGCGREGYLERVRNERVLLTIRRRQLERRRDHRLPADHHAVRDRSLRAVVVYPSLCLSGGALHVTVIGATLAQRSCRR